MDATPASPWRALLDAPGPGDHIILWSDGSGASDEAVATYLRGGLRRNDLLLVSVPRAEFSDLEIRLSPWNLSLEPLVNEGHLIRVPFEDANVASPRDLEGIPAAIEALLDLATGMGKAGLTVLGRVAPVFFERGDSSMAERIEQVAQDHRRYARMLCLYDAKSLRPDRFQDGVRVTRRHTHTLAMVGGGKFLAEPVRERADP